ncbi:hypothetical protein LCGC14_1750110 [marine sediment metagenome]|uniref:Uncharacterized protein n=1 Tax=marine sediment metagenome TaxID=412755 RepID=A0A0F9JJB5_9ZZZZ
MDRQLELKKLAKINRTLKFYILTEVDRAVLVSIKKIIEHKFKE